MRKRTALLFGAIFAAALLLRLCHAGILWVEEAYPSAAALEILRGRSLYRDIWFDKPPLFPLLYLLWGAQSGWPLRLAGAGFVLLSSLAAWWSARRIWSGREAALAAALLAFFLSFGVPSAVMALTPDLLMVPLQILAVGLAAGGAAPAAGLVAGIAIWFNPKALLVCAACLPFVWRDWRKLTAGFALPLFAGLVTLGLAGLLPDFWKQVWLWGRIYSRDTPFDPAWIEGLRRTLNWSGFHATLIAGCLVFFWKERETRRAPYALWLLIAFAGVILGMRFFPRYYFHLLAPAVMIAARGLLLLPRRQAAALLLLLVVPFARYAPRYAILASDLFAGRAHEWGDLALEQDSRDAAMLLQSLRPPSNTLLVWGYRPELFVFTGLPAATRYLDSQPLSGVIADRHLTSSHISFPALARRNRENLLKGRLPAVVIDGLGPLNPALAFFESPDLRTLRPLYEKIGETRFCVIYRMNPDGFELYPNERFRPLMELPPHIKR